jgi:hypothetical protein
MRYIDTGSRDPDHALGTWLLDQATLDPPVVALRWQSGFFGAGALRYLSPIVAQVATNGGSISALIGSNDGGTLRADIEALRAMAQPVQSLSIGIVHFGNAYFHPKTIHLTRTNGHSAAYVGSANLTQAGTSSLHVEAGLLLDSTAGDSTAVLTAIADAIDWWFADERAGLSLVSSDTDLLQFVGAGILDVPRPKRPPQPKQPTSGGGTTPVFDTLAPLVAAPPLTSAAEPSDTVDQPAEPDSAGATAAPTPTVDVVWSKLLSTSDAQRKPTGNQRGSITLVQAGYPIDAQTYFRYNLFASASWQADSTRTGQPIESAPILARVSFLGQDLGVLAMKVTYAPNREAAQANYTSLLHIGPLAPHFSSTDVTGKRIELRRLSDSTFVLDIQQ